MKSLTTLLLITVNSIAFSQTADNQIAEIRRLYKETQTNKPTYTKFSQDDFENSSEGGDLMVYKNSSDVRLIEATYYGHMGKVESEYYYIDGQVYFIYRKNHKYNMPSSELDYDQSKTIVEEFRYYFWNGEMIRWVIPDGKYVNLTSPEFSKESNKRSNYAAKLLGIVK